MRSRRGRGGTAEARRKLSMQISVFALPVINADPKENRPLQGLLSLLRYSHLIKESKTEKAISGKILKNP